MTTGRLAHLVLLADLGGTFLFAIEGALAAMAAGLDPVGVVALAFLTALGGGIMRDLLIGASPPAAIADWRYAPLVLAAAAATWGAHGLIAATPPMLVTALDAAGLALFVVAGTEKAILRGIHPFVAIFPGTVGAVGGGALRDIALNEVPRILRVDVYATAALAAAIVIAIGRAMHLPARATAIVAALLCIALRMLAVAYGWQLPHAPA